MENYTCHTCGKEVPECNRNIHNLTCKNTISNDDFKDLIPCEYCNHLVEFSDYSNHIQNCEYPRFNFSFFPGGGASASNSNSEPINIENSQFSVDELDQLNAERPVDFFSILDSVLTQIENHYPNFEGIDANNPETYSELTELGNSIGNVEIGLQNLSDYLIEKTYTTDELFNCDICNFKKTKTYETKCGHEFCKECCEEWFSSNKKCPYCLIELEKISK